MTAPAGGPVSSPGRGGLRRVRPPRGGRRSAALVALIALAVALLAGCAGIPGSGPARDIHKVGDQVDPTAPQAPDPGQAPDQIVRGFLSASARTDYDTLGTSYVQAREYLTTSADKAWQADSSDTPVVILQDQYNAAPASSDEPGTIEVTGVEVGALATDRSFRPVDDRPFTVKFHLVQVAGEWRITDPPSEIILTQSGFASAFHSRTVYFLDATGRVVVPDIRYLADSGAADLSVPRLMDLLIRGPSASISGAARTQLGAGATLRYVQVDDNGVAHIDLDGVDISTAAARQGLVAQIVWTLNPDVQNVQITINGDPLGSLGAGGTVSPSPSPSTGSSGPSGSSVPSGQAGQSGQSGQATSLTPAPSGSSGPSSSSSTPAGQGLGATGSGSGAGTYSFSDVASFDPDAVPGTGQAVSDAYYIASSGAILRVSDSSTMWGAVGTGSIRVRSAALSAATGTLAAVADSSSGGVQLLIGHPFDFENVSAVMKAKTLTQPTFTRSGDEVWVVQNGTTKPAQPEVYRVTTTTGTPTWTRVPARGLNGIGAVTALVLSPDGVRVAVVADGKLYLGTIAPAGTDTGDSAGQPGERSAVQITNLAVLRDDLVDVGPVTFLDSTTLLVGARPTPGYRTVYEVGIDGQSVDPVTSVNIQADVDAIASPVGDPAASADRPMLISFGPPDRVYELSGSIPSGRWVSPNEPQLLSGTFPFYPN